jgi:hypothetical protein
VALQRSAGNAAVTRLVTGQAAGGSAPPPPQPTAGDVAILARLKDTARARSAMHPADRAAEDPPIHPADLAALDLDKPKHHAAHRPQPAPTPALAPEPAGPTPEQQLAELRAKAPDLAREIVDAATATLDPAKQVASFQERAEKRLAAEQQAVLAALAPVTDPAAAGHALQPLVRARVPALAKALEEEAIKELAWGPLNKLGANQTPGFDAGQLIREVRGAIEGWGTDEARLFKALEGHTPLQIAAMRKAYQGTYERNMDEDIDDDLGGSEKERAHALLTGDPVAGAVATLRDAMDGAGTDEDTIMRTLRSRPAAERAKILEAYEKTYHRPLKADLDDELGGYEFREADALLAGDTVKADAIALKNAMDGIGTDEPAIHAVYARIRDEVEHEATEKGWKTAQLQAELQRRTGRLKTAYDKQFGSLEEDFDSELSGGDLNLALAEQAGDQTGIDAAELQIEHLSAWTSDDKVNEILKSQYARAEREIMRDLAVDFQRQAATLPREQRAAAWKALQQQGRQEAERRSRDYMNALKSRYDATAIATSFDFLIDRELSGNSKDEAKARIAAGGKLSDAEELKYAIFGLGTNEKTIREVLKHKSKAELDQLSKAYEKLTGNDLIEDLKGDLSGRDEADMTLLLETGDATLEERRAYLDKRTHWELNEGTGRWGALVDDEEAEVLNNTNAAAGAAYRDYEAVKDLPEDDPRRREAQERLERWLGYGDKDIERHREQLDSVTDTIAMVGAITVGIAITILSAGAGGIGALALFFGVTQTAMAAGVGAVTAAAASMWIKENMKGGAYGGEEIATDMAVQTANAVVTVATAGVGEAAIKALSRVPAFAILARAAEGGALSRIALKGAGGGVEGLIQGLPTGMMGAILNEDTWRSPNPLGVILQAGGKSAIQTAGVSAGMGTAMHGIHEGVRALRGAGEAAAPHDVNDPDAIDRRSGGGPRDVDDVLAELDAERELDDLAAELGAEPIVDLPPTDNVPITDLWEGTVIDHDPPFTAAEAEKVYWNTVAHSDGREAMVMRNPETGEHIVIQGSESEVAACRSALDGLRLAGKPGPWRPVRHFHTVDASGMTPMKYRYPSGIGGDMAGAREIALKTGEVHIEWIDIVTERGPEKVYFGYDPAAKRYLVTRPTTEGPGAFETFAKLDEYHEWVERETGEPLEVLGRRADPDDPAQRKAADPPGGPLPDVDDGWDDPTQVDAEPQLNAVPLMHQAARLLARFPTADALRAEVIQQLSTLGHGMDPATLPPQYVELVQSLAALPRGANPTVARLLPIVAGSLRNPAVWAEVLVDAWEAIRANAQQYPDFNRALIALARLDGYEITAIPRAYGTDNDYFIRDYAATQFHFVDLPFLGNMHRALTHLTMDLVVNKGFQLAGEAMTSSEFRAMLQGCEGWVDDTTLRVVPEGTPEALRMGDAVWVHVYDVLGIDHLNSPEDVGRVLNGLIGLQ